MYENYFGLKTEPFTIAPNPRFLYMSKQHHEALAHLVYGVSSSGGFILLTGEVGTGKTTVCRAFLEQMPEGCDVAFIFNPKLCVRELLSTICDEFGITVDGVSQKEHISALNQYLLDAHGRGRKAVLIIDEAQNLSASVLEQLRLLTNLETNDTKLLQIVLLGQPELKQLFEREELRQLAQRVTARYHLAPLSLAETAAYIQHRLSVAGRHDRLFSTRAVKMIHRLSGGIPRVVNLLCDRSLLGAYCQTAHHVDKKMVSQAAKEALGLSPRRIVWLPRMINVLTGGVAALFVGLLYVTEPHLLFFNDDQVPKGDQLLEGSQASGAVSVVSDVSEKNALLAQRAPSQGVANGTLADRQSAGASDVMERVIEKRATVKSQDPGVDVSDQHAVSVKSTVKAAQGDARDDTLGGALDEVLLAKAQNSSVEAYSTLLKLWGIDDRQWRQRNAQQQGPVSFCEWARALNMGCIMQKGELSDLALLNRPAVVTLTFIESGEAHEVDITLLALTESDAHAQLNNKEVQFTRSALSNLWSGQYTVLWKRPPVYHGDIVLGTVGPEIRFLSKKLGELQKDPDLAQGILMYDELFREKVKAFQVSMGLKPDGIVGVRTWMKLNAESGLAVPLLAKRIEE